MQKKYSHYRNIQTGRFESYKKAKQYRHIIAGIGEKGKKSKPFKPIKIEYAINIKDVKTGKWLKLKDIVGRNIAIYYQKKNKKYISTKRKLNKKEAELLDHWIRKQKQIHKKIKKPVQVKKFKNKFNLSSEEIDALNDLFALNEEFEGDSISLIQNFINYFVKVSDLDIKLKPEPLVQFKKYCLESIENYPKNKLDELNYQYFELLFKKYFKK